MSFNWLSYIELADKLRAQALAATDPSSARRPSDLSPVNPSELEAFHRASVSRAYYAVFHLTSDFVTSQGEDLEGKSSVHQYLGDLLIKSNRQGWSRVGRNLKELHQWRVQADYQDNLRERNASNFSSKALARAKKIITDLDEL